MTTYFNIVNFVPAGGPGAAMLLESPWKMTAGIKPDLNRAICNYQEFAHLDIGSSGDIQFCFNNAVTPDLIISDVLLLDAEVVEYGIPAGQVNAIPVKYRLVFVDKRYGFVEPRGGRLTQGLLNPSVIPASDPARTNVPEPQTLADLIQMCATAMGLAATIPAITQLPPQDLKWFGTHAPTELAKLLAMANQNLVLQPNGSFEIVQLGTGADPTISKPLPAAMLSGADGRGETVVFTSYPTQVAACLTQADLNGGDLMPVVQNASGAWVPIDSAGVYNGSGSTTAIQAMNDHFGGTVNVPDPNEQYGCYRFLRLNPNVFDPAMSPILRKTWAVPGDVADATPADPDASSPDDDSGNPNNLPPQIDIDFRAKVATQDASTMLWSMPSGFVRIPVKAIHDGNVLELSHRLVKLNLSGGATTTPDLEGNCAAINFNTDIQIRFSAGMAVWNAGQGIFTPAYFYTGFSGTPEAMTTLSSTAAQAAINEPDTIVLPIAELQGVAFGSGAAGSFTTTLAVYNQDALVGQCQLLAARYLKDASKPPRSLAGVGFFNFTFNGKISEVEIDQQAVMTRFRVDSWFRPVGSYLGREFYRLRKKEEAHPHEAKTAGKRAALGESGSAAPVQPMQTYTPPTSIVPPFTLFAVNVNQSGGSNGSQTSPPSWTYNVFSKADGTQIGTALSPEWNRSNGSFVAASVGTAYNDLTPTLHLFQVSEAEETVGCGS